LEINYIFKRFLILQNGKINFRNYRKIILWLASLGRGSGDRKQPGMQATAQPNRGVEVARFWPIAINFHPSTPVVVGWRHCEWHSIAIGNAPVRQALALISYFYLDGNVIPGARIKHAYDLAEMDLCWEKDLLRKPAF